MNSPDISPSEHPQMKKSLRLRFRNEHGRAWGLYRKGLRPEDAPKPKIDSMEMEDYMIECAAIPRESILSVIAPDEENLPRGLEQMYPAGNEHGNSFCVVVLPFASGALGQNVLEPARWNQFIADQRFMKHLVFENTDHVTQGYDDMPGYFFDHLPELIKKDISEGGCTFRLEYPYAIGDGRNKEWFAKKYRQSLHNLQGFFKELGLQSPLPDA